MHNFNILLHTHFLPQLGIFKTYANTLQISIFTFLCVCVATRLGAYLKPIFLSSFVHTESHLGNSSIMCFTVYYQILPAV